MEKERALKLWYEAGKKVKFLNIALPRITFEPRMQQACRESMDKVHSLERTMTHYSTRNDFGVGYVNCYLEIDKAYIGILIDF